jgi:hypothetical protein
MDREMELRNAARFVRIKDGSATVADSILSGKSEDEDEVGDGDETPFSASSFRRFEGGDGMIRDVF